MFELRCLDDLPSIVLDLLKTLLAASSRGETAVLVLETKKKAVNTKYRSVDIVEGSSQGQEVPAQAGSIQTEEIGRKDQK